MSKNSQKYHNNIQLTLLWLCYRWVNSEQALPPLHVWNHFIFLFSDRFCATDCQILSYRNLSTLDQTHLVGKNSPKYHKNNKFSCLNLIYLFCMYFHQLRTNQTMGLVQTTNKGYWRNFECFHVFFVPFWTVLNEFFSGEACVWFWNNKIFPTWNKFLFQGEMSLGTVSELFKHVSTHLKRLRKLWLWWEQFYQSAANYTNILYLKTHLSRETCAMH